MAVEQDRLAVPRATAVRSPDGSSDGRTADAEQACIGVYPAGCDVSEVQEPSGRRRFVIADPATEARWSLGPAEYTVAGLFDGQSTYREIEQKLKHRHRIASSVEKLKAFEHRLLQMGLLQGAPQTALARDPFTGFNFGWLHRLIVLRLFAFNPDPHLDRLVRACPWLFGRGCMLAALAVSLAGSAVLVARGDAFLAAVPGVLSGWGWVWLYGIIALSGIFHEGGHVLACKAYGVRVRQVGLAIYFLLPTAWTLPAQSEWIRLRFGERVVTIIAGPIGSLCFGGGGVLLWAAAPAGSLASDLCVMVTITAAFGTIPTMLPIFNGDGYLLLIEWLRQPNLRRRSFDYLRQYLLRRSEAMVLPLRRRVLYLTVAIGTIVGWIIVTASLLYKLGWIMRPVTASLPL